MLIYIPFSGRCMDLPRVHRAPFALPQQSTGLQQPRLPTLVSLSPSLRPSFRGSECIRIEARGVDFPQRLSFSMTIYPPALLFQNRTIVAHSCHAGWVYTVHYDSSINACSRSLRSSPLSCCTGIDCFALQHQFLIARSPIF